MSFHEKRAIVSMISSVLIPVFYALFVFQKYLAGSPETVQNLRFWGWAFLVFVLVSVVVRIIIAIAFMIVYRITTDEDGPSFSDERDKLIDLKATRNSHYVFSIGVALAIVSLVLDVAPVVMILAIVASGMISQVIEEITQLRLYRRGF